MLAARYSWTSLSSLRFDSVGGWTSSIISAHRSTPSRCDGAPSGGPAPRHADRLWRPSAPLTRQHPPRMRNLDTHGGVEPPGSAFAAQCLPGELTTCVRGSPRGRRPEARGIMASAVPCAGPRAPSEVNGALSGDRTRIPRSTIWCPGRWTMRASGGPGRIRTGFFRVRGGCPAVGRQAQWLRVWDLHPPAWRMKPDWNYLQQTRVGCSGRTRTCIWRLMRPLWNPSRHAAVLVESHGFEP